jgi:hypothetical protein
VRFANADPNVNTRPRACKICDRCGNTTAGGAQRAEALSGLARAFFYAGARSLLVSRWAVKSAAHDAHRFKIMVAVMQTGALAHEMVDAVEPKQAYQDEIDGNDVVQKAWKDQDQNAGNEGDERRDVSDGESHF